MLNLLRSVIDVNGKITQENLVFNYTKLLNAKIDWGRSDDDKLFKFLYQYFQTQLEMPSLDTVRDYFERTDDLEVKRRLEVIETAVPYTRSNFHHLLSQLLEEQAKLRAVALLKETNDIITRGLEIDGEKKHGIRDGLLHFSAKASELLTSEFNSKSRGNIRQDGEDMKREYTTAENNKDKVWGRFTGIKEIDEACRGAKRGELWVHGAFPGELKTTFAANWCYNLITQYNTNVLYISLEMPYEQVRRNIYTIHAASAKWAKHGIQPPDFRGIDYRKIRDGDLSPEEKAFYFDRVIPDFNTNPDYRVFEVINPDKEMNMHDIRMEAELLNRQIDGGLGFVVIDHGQWVEARKTKKHKDYTIELNTIVRDGKQFAMRFDNNTGIPVLLLWQINRDGKDEADKAEGEYKLKAFTYANEVEKTADVVTTTYLNKNLREDSMTILSNPKNRDNPPFLPFKATAHLTTRRMKGIDKDVAVGAGMGVTDGHEYANLNDL
jgi:replicative DNA helicase